MMKMKMEMKMRVKMEIITGESVGAGTAASLISARQLPNCRTVSLGQLSDAFTVCNTGERSRQY
jgi:hypothetical protein